MVAQVGSRHRNVPGKCLFNAAGQQDFRESGRPRQDRLEPIIWRGACCILSRIMRATAAVSHMLLALDVQKIINLVLISLLTLQRLRHPVSRVHPSPAR